jgi:hypothetical protein
MHLTAEEERILDGESGDTKQKAMEILVALGKIYDADSLIPVVSCQVAGVSYRSIGDSGAEWIESLEGDEVVVPTTLNPAGMDLIRWREMGIPDEFAQKQLRILRAYLRLGIRPTCSCTPYLAGNRPSFGQHIAWSESSAVAYANSVIGARTNREGGPSSLASALIGKTPKYGYHLSENRQPTMRVEVGVPLEDYSDFAVLGFWTGRVARNGVPLFTGVNSASSEDLKQLGAALAASGGVALYHVEGITPESRDLDDTDLERFSFGADQFWETYESLSSSDTGDVDLVCFGCPHCSLAEIKRIADLVRGKRISDEVRLWVFASAAVRMEALEKGLVEVIEEAGGRIFSDTCMVVAPMRDLGIRRMTVNSAKAAFYGPTVPEVKIVFGSLDDCVGMGLRDE